MKSKLECANVVNVPAILGHGCHIGCVVSEAHDVQGHEAQRRGVVFARANIAVGEHLGDLVNDSDGALLRRPSQIEDDASESHDMLGHQVKHVRLLHHLDDQKVVMER